LKKRTKKLLPRWAAATLSPQPIGIKSFFAAFFSKKAVLPCLAIRLSGNSRNIIRRAARPRYRSATGGFDE
jgi:hypothetical protein